MKREGLEFSINSEDLAKAIRDACELEVTALKPGNVSSYRAGHGMTAADFLVSAEAIASPMTARDSSIGERIFNSVVATRGCVGCNTNLGIILLFAPIVHAALFPEPERSLKTRVNRHLATLDLMDAELAFKAICLASPGGLGNVSRHDVRRSAEVTLLHAMREAKARDLVARQYANGYRDVFEVGVRSARSALARWHSPEWMAVAVYLAYLARFPDSLIARKRGMAAAREVSATARIFAAKLSAEPRPVTLVPALLAWDEQLKNAGLNPGTSADLTAATLLALKAQEKLLGEFSGSGRPSNWERTPARAM